MPSKTPKQAKFMRAIAHGWKPSRMKSPPSRAVAQEFVEADRKYSGGFAENRYWTGGLAAMNEVTAGGKRGSLDLFKWQRGGRAGRRRNGGAGTSTTMNVPTVTAPPSPYGTEAGTTQEMRDRLGYSGVLGYVGTVSGLRQAGWTPAPGADPDDLASTMWYPPEGTLTGEGGPGGPSEPPPRIIPTDPASYIGASAEEKAALKESPYRDQLREHQARILETLGSARGGHVNYYDAGGPVRAGHPEDTGKRGPNPWDPEDDVNAYKYWETRYHQEPEPEPEVVAAVPEKVPWYMRLAGYGSEESAEEIQRKVTEAQTGVQEEAYGGRVGYQTGGLAIAAPAGGVPPWISPTGVVEPVQEFQFGGGARGRRSYRGVPPQRGGIQRGAPPGGGRGFLNRFRQQAQAQRGALPGGGQPQGGLSAMLSRGDPRMRVTGRQSYRLPPGIDPRAVAADPQGWAQQQMEQARAGMGGPGGGVIGGGPEGGGLMDRIGVGGGRFGEEMRRARGQQTYQDVVNRGGGGINPMQDDGMRLYDPRRQTGGGGVAPGNVGTLGGPGYGEYPLGSAGPRMDPSDPRYRAAPPPGSTFAPGEGIPGGGNIPPWKRPPGGRIAPPPGKYPGGSGPYNPEGGGITGGPRVPPNMRGYLQKMRMQNRPPSGPVGGGGNRVGMQDQQGALSRALQRGTGRPPMSRRGAFGRAQ